MPGTRLIKRDWVKDHVYLVQFPRAGCIPSPSPFALKVETWLRMANIPYTNISNNFSKFSDKGQIPFIEVNGREIADSNFIIDHLIEELHKKDIDDRLSPEEKANARAYHALIEDSLRWVLIELRSRDNKWFASNMGFLPHFEGFKKMAFKNFVCEMIRRKLQAQAKFQGMGRNSPEEVTILAKKDLDALSQFLGNKQYFFGDQPVTLDCEIFAHLAQFLYTPLPASPELRTYIQEHCQNLVAFVERMKARYWPDWEEATNKRSMDSDWKKHINNPNLDASFPPNVDTSIQRNIEIKYTS
ncbi:unnamed protein product [Cylicocyclus nassatus]|uniref:Failed axon connections protein n=1 Tax=Cylicocyclus nassatus TaxID=53992 RepID=A0AA36M2A1_CYLNA|nr:unnamed protein product [Cylicocyclus nassatus]